MLYDEPTTGLDPITAYTIDQLIVSLRKGLGVTSIVVSHDLPSINAIADHVVLIDEGESVTVGHPREFMSTDDPRVLKFTGSWREQILAHAATISGGKNIAGHGGKGNERT